MVEDRTDDGRTPRWAMVCAGTSLIAVCYGFARFAYGLFAPDFQRDFALGPTISGVIGSGSYVGYSVAIIAGLLLTERVGARPVALAAGAVATLGTAVVAAAPNATVLAAGVLIAGSSTGLASPPLAAAVARWVVREIRDRAQTIVNAGTGVGVLLSGPIALLLTDNWRLAWGVFSGTCALVTVWIAATVPATRPAFCGPGSSGSTIVTGTRRLLLAAVLMGVASSAVWTFGRDVVTTVGGAGPSESALMWMVVGASGLAGAVSADLTVRVGLARAWSWVLVAMSAATVLLAIRPGFTASALVSAALFGSTYIALCGLLLVWSTRIYPDRPSFGVGASFLMIAVGQAVGAPLVGVVIDLAGFLSAFGLVAVVGLVGAAVRPGAESTANGVVTADPRSPWRRGVPTGCPTLSRPPRGSSRGGPRPAGRATRSR